MKLTTMNFLLLLFFSIYIGANKFYAQTITEKISTEKKQHLIAIKSLPSDLPNNVVIPITYAGESLSLVLEKTTVFGKNTKCLVDDGKGNMVQVPMNTECTYLGRVAENEKYSVSAVLTKGGLVANIFRPGQSTLEIYPNDKNKTLHHLTEVTEAYRCTSSCNSSDSHVSGGINFESNTNSSDLQGAEPSLGAITTNLYMPKSVAMPTRATRRPTNRMEVREFEIGVEIGSRSFFSNTAYKGNLSAAQASAQSIIGNLNLRFLRSAGVRFKLGTVIIRTAVNTDPLRNSVTSTGGADNSTESLRAFGDYWNNNPNVVGNTHDLAVYHVAARPSGLAWLNGVGNTRNRYATMGGNGPTSWANGTAAHEVGHSFGLRHVNDANFFFEDKPRNRSGSNSRGGEQSFISIMDGRGRHNISRMATNEARVVMATKNRLRSSAPVINNPPAINPFGVYDEVEIPTGQSSIIIDVIANDYDMNNDVLDVRILDRVSSKGGNISISNGTGPGGRNQIRYTPPSNNFSGRDFFHYTVFDTSGKTDFGAVYVTQTRGFSPNDNEATFDFGTATSPVFNNAIRVSNTTNNPNYRWTNRSGLGSRDRGGASNVNALNRDFVQSSQNRTFEINVRNGVWEVLLTFGDRDFAHDDIVVKAEGRTRVNNFDATKGRFENRRFDVEVKDGKLTLEFSDNGGNDPNWIVNRLRIKRLRDLPNSNNNTNRAPIGSVISLRGNNNKYVSSENGAKPMNCNRNSVGVWERFTVVDAGGGKIALKGNNGKYVSSENGISSMTCNRDRIGNWEKFTWGTNRGGVTLKGNNNKFVSSESGRSPMNCNRDNANLFERFNVAVVSGRKLLEDSGLENSSIIYPNPTANIATVEGLTIGDIITITDVSRKTIAEITASSTTEQLDLTNVSKGIYLVKINNNKTFKIVKE
ncbi:Ig-like domain-containing protein [Aquimarina agarivorans]|uniref:Ig-like domain-containing protein n=1 Tax=Aquimarina agarivorans TaxID=980584 RepID=UPI000248F8A2|nr:T9SS type A sorting domain-containing protein [Aquimarina agarivorans]